jgi:hypothetical protein
MCDTISLVANKLTPIFGNTVTVRLIHEGKDICMNCNQREILYTIQEFLQEKYDLNWSYKENMYGKSLMSPIECGNYSTISFDGILTKYKVKYIERIQIIIDKYDYVSNIDKQLYENIKQKYFEMTNKQEVVFEEYQEIRKQFENIRH